MPAPSTEGRGRQHNGNPSRGECAASLASHYFTVSICNWKEASLKCAKSINYPNTLALTSCKIGITSRCHVCSFLSHHVSVGVLYHSTWEGRNVQPWPLDGKLFLWAAESWHRHKYPISWPNNLIISYLGFFTSEKRPSNW